MNLKTLTWPNNLYWVDPIKLSATKRVIRGIIPADKFLRLREMIELNNANILCEMGFYKETSNYCIEGKSEVLATAVCSRCMHKMDIKLSNDFKLVVCQTDEEAKNLDKSLDPVIMQDGKISVLEIVEDGLMLSLPFAIKHEYGSSDCSYFKNMADYQLRQSKENQFSVLKDLANCL